MQRSGFATTVFIEADEKHRHAGGTLLGLQALRGVACLMVVAFHALEVGGVHWANLSGGVDLFFVISGYVMVASSRRLACLPGGWRFFLARRLERIVPLYWLLTAAKLAIALTAPWLTPATRPTAWNLAASLLFIPARDATGLIRPVLPVGWTLNYEMLFYLVFAAALALRRAPLSVLLPLFLPLAAAGFWRTGAWPAPLSLANGLVLEFCAGVALAQCRARFQRPCPGLCAALLLGGLALLLLTPEAGAWRFAAWGLPALAVVAGTIGLEDRLRRLLPSLAIRLGDASYAIYLSHVFLIPVLAHAITRAGLPPGAATAVHLAVSLVVCAAVGMALDAAIDAPIQARLHARRRAARA